VGKIAFIVLLATFTVLSGLMAPRARRRKRSEKKASAPTRPDRPHLDLVEPNPAQRRRPGYISAVISIVIVRLKRTIQ